MKLQLAQSQPHEPNGCVRNILHWWMKDETFIHSLPIPHRNECRVINQVFSPICPSHSNNQPCAAYALKESAYTHLPICPFAHLRSHRVLMKIIINSMDPPGRVRWANYHRHTITMVPYFDSIKNACIIRQIKLKNQLITSVRLINQD